MRGQHQPQGPRKRTQQLQDSSQSRRIHQPLCDWQERDSRLPELCRKRKEEERFPSKLSKQNLQKHPEALSSTLGRARREATACRHAEPRAQQHAEAGKAQGRLRAPTSLPPKCPCTSLLAVGPVSHGQGREAQPWTHSRPSTTPSLRLEFPKALLPGSPKGQERHTQFPDAPYCLPRAWR